MSKRDQIAALVREGATGLGYRGNAWLLRGALAVFPTAPHRRLAAESEKTVRRQRRRPLRISAIRSGSTERRRSGTSIGDSTPKIRGEGASHAR